MRALRADEVGAVHAVAGLLVPLGGAPAVGDGRVIHAASQQSAQVGLVVAEQARAHGALGGDARAVARLAERAGDRGDDADGGRAAVAALMTSDEPLLGGRRRVLAVRLRQREARAEHVEQLLRLDHVVAHPGLVGVERHLLDEAQPHVVRERPLEQVGGAREGVAHEHGVDLERGESRALRGLDAGEHRGQPVAAGEAGEVVAVHGVERDVDAGESGIHEFIDALVEPDAVRGQD